MLLADGFELLEIESPTMLIYVDVLFWPLPTLIDVHPRDAGPNADKGGFVEKLMQDVLICAPLPNGDQGQTTVFDPVPVGDRGVYVAEDIRGDNKLERSRSRHFQIAIDINDGAVLEGAVSPRVKGDLGVHAIGVVQIGWINQDARYSGLNQHVSFLAGADAGKVIFHGGA